MTQLPTCRFRGEAYPDGSLPCRSPLVHAPSGTVSAATCVGCTLADKVPQRIVTMEGPTWFQMGVNFAGALASHAAAGAPVTPPSEQKARVAACMACEYRTGRTPEDFGCKECGCDMQVKVTWAEQRCPHPQGSRWPLPTA